MVGVGLFLTVRRRNIQKVIGPAARGPSPEFVLIGYFVEGECLPPVDNPQSICLQSRSRCGRNSVVECNLAKVEVAGSNPVARSIDEKKPRRRKRFRGFFSPARKRRPRTGGPWHAGLQRSIPSDPGIRGPLHPRRLRCPPSPYRGGYASAGRLAGRGASTLSVHGLFRNGPLDAGGLRYQTLATCARSLPFRSTQFPPRSTGRSAEPPASPRVHVTGDIPDSSPGCGRGVSPPSPRTTSMCVVSWVPTSGASRRSGGG